MFSRHFAVRPLLQARHISNSRAIIYSQNGDPSSVVRVASFKHDPTPAPPNSVKLRFLLSPINPADVNVIQGVYPSKPEKRTLGQESDIYVGGNEALAEVQETTGDERLRKGDWVVMSSPQLGTWRTHATVSVDKVTRIPQDGLSQVHAACFTVNPMTALNMLHFRGSSEPWIMQNGANSAVGQAVIQIAAAEKTQTLNFLRKRDNPEEHADLVRQLKDLGATHVFTYQDLEDQDFGRKLKSITNGQPVKLGLNCVGGRETSLMSKYLGRGATLVSYGAMSKQPLSLPTSLFIFKDLEARGFWQTKWFENASPQERQARTDTLVELMRSGKLREPAHEIVAIRPSQTDEEATSVVRRVFEKISQGRYGKKVLVRFDE